MDRVIIYPGQIPLDTDQLSQNRSTMLGLGHLAQALLGSGTMVSGLNCTQTTPASMNVLVAAGSIYSPQNVDATSYGSLAADTTNQAVKQGIVQAATTLACAAPATAGHSRVYLVQATYQDADAGPAVLPYYNAADPSVPYSGPANSGVAQFTVRRGVCVLGLKAGVAATTGTQVTPAPDAGYVGLWAITVANGQATITSTSIAPHAGAPFIVPNPQKLNVNSNLSDVANAATALANLGGVPLGSVIKSVKITTLAAGGTYTPSAGMLQCLVEVAGGGGGGGGSTASGSYPSAGGGGGAGGYGCKLFPAADIGASLAFTVGPGGAGGGAGSPGSGGGTTTFGTLSAAGGNGGAAGAASVATGRGGPGGAGGGSSGGTTAIPGGAGTAGIVLSGSSLGGQGGAGALSGASSNAVENTAGSAGSGAGAGGGGGAALGTTAYPGGAGAPGCVRITEYCSQ